MNSLAFLALLAASSTGASTISLEAPATIRLDGQLYAIGAGSIGVADGTFLASQSLAMQDCSRSGGGGQQLSANSWRWTEGLRVVFLAPEAGGIQLEYAHGAWTIALQSTTGDVQCAGKIVDPGTIFLGGFE